MVVLTAEELIALARFPSVFRTFRCGIFLLLRQEVGLVLHEEGLDGELVYQADALVYWVLHMNFLFMN